MYAIMDMGTTNTRLYMCTNNKVIDFVKGRAEIRMDFAWKQEDGHTAGVAV